MSAHFTICPDCGEPMEVDYVNNGVCMVWHGVHCGWGQAYMADDEVVMASSIVEARPLLAKIKESAK